MELRLRVKQKWLLRKDGNEVVLLEKFVLDLAGGRRNGEIVLRLGKPGRKPDPFYDRAYERIRAGETVQDVFAWFCEEQNIIKPDKNLRDSFKKAMKRRATK